MVEQSLKFLNTLCLSIKNEIMFPIRQSHKISRSIVMFDSVKMVNNPTIRQRLSISFFPNKNMLHNIAFLLGMRMRGLTDKNITTFTKCSAPFPLRVFFREAILHRLYLAGFAHSCGFMHFATTLRTYFGIMFRMVQAILPSQCSSSITPIISFCRFLSSLINTTLTKLFIANFGFETLLAIFAILNHLKYKFNTTQIKSQVIMGGSYG